MLPATADSEQCPSSNSSASSSSSSSTSIISVLPPELIACPSRSAPATDKLPARSKAGDCAVGIIYDESMERHVGPEHYERPQRIIQVFETLKTLGLMDRCHRLASHQVTDEELLRAHNEEHLKKVEEGFTGRVQEEGADVQLHVELPNDLYMCSESVLAARYAAGCVVKAVRSVLQGKVQSALAVVRPPGHHAECERAMGFCFFNNVAVAAREALAHEGVKKVLVLDWDVHHGNGIQDILWEDPNALYISIHRDPQNFYPYHYGFMTEVGKNGGLGFNVNIPWQRRGAGDADYAAAFETVVEPIVKAYGPDLILVAAGYDAAKGDPLGGCNLTPSGYFDMTRRLMALSPNGKVVLALEGGYNTRVTAECVGASVRALLGEHSVLESEAANEEEESVVVSAAPPSIWPSESTAQMLKAVAEIQRSFWPVLSDFETTWNAYLTKKVAAKEVGTTKKSRVEEGRLMALVAKLKL
ncbi:hypothetical protein CEUSTIGMA_g9026.t1 [Chlamydomonas eustigma]|uniref:histone deacetylase n=1 Tax=Chlamydomonas eustigma TaxID=1157962 RepID=A0A250XEU7_9CHLO|nr:hypothetical protein CEUSTIGMA_g9026.t1 [Chlamydomonas eustigma]|eukprot:GAX81598.1 hypothetical protein CEUSTIGMA_g9026.t1 [Chlamydomonas eustigma]